MAAIRALEPRGWGKEDAGKSSSFIGASVDEKGNESRFLGDRFRPGSCPARTQGGRKETPAARRDLSVRERERERGTGPGVCQREKEGLVGPSAGRGRMGCGSKGGGEERGEEEVGPSGHQQGEVFSLFLFFLYSKTI